jgi:hypothetical protein
MWRIGFDLVNVCHFRSHVCPSEESRTGCAVVRLYKLGKWNADSDSSSAEQDGVKASRPQAVHPRIDGQVVYGVRGCFLGVQIELDYIKDPRDLRINIDNYTLIRHPEVYQPSSYLVIGNSFQLQ